MTGFQVQLPKDDVLSRMLPFPKASSLPAVLAGTEPPNP